MPDIAQNVKMWGSRHAWRRRGDEWSAEWGGPEMQWSGTLLPRLHLYLPVPSVLEIAPGFGRWTQFLKDVCDRLAVVDLNASCIEACRQRFSSSSHIDYFVNDGRSLEMIADASVDFIFSFDSLVHAEIDVIDAYLGQFPRILTKNGVAFIHHSNLADCSVFARWAHRVPKIRAVLRRVPVVRELANPHWRAASVSAPRFAEVCRKHGLRCLSQEIVNWSGRTMCDCLSTVTTRDSAVRGGNVVLRNPRFMAEAHNLRRLAKLYGAEARVQATKHEAT